MPSTRVAIACLIAAACGAPALSAQELSLVETIDRPLVRDNADELSIVVEANASCRIGLDLLTETVLDVLRRGRPKDQRSVALAT